MHYNKIVHSVRSSPMRMPKYVYLVHMHSVPICLDFSRLFFCVLYKEFLPMTTKVVLG